MYNNHNNNNVKLNNGTGNSNNKNNNTNTINNNKSQSQYINNNNPNNNNIISNYPYTNKRYNTLNMIGDDNDNDNDNDNNNNFIEFNNNGRSNVATPKLLNYYPGGFIPYGVTRIHLSRITNLQNGSCLADFGSLRMPGSQVVEGVVLVNMSDLVPKTIIDALLSDYTVGNYKQGYSKVIRPFINGFLHDYNGLMTRLFSLRMQNYTVVLHLDISTTVNYLFRRNSKFYKGLSTTEINEIIIDKVNGFLTELINCAPFRFAEYELALKNNGMSKDDINKMVNGLQINNVSAFNYIISLQHDNYHLSGGTASLNMILDNIKSYNKYTSPIFTSHIYYVSSQNIPDVLNLSSGVNTNLMFMLSNHNVVKKHTRYPVTAGDINNLTNNDVVKFINIDYIMKKCNTYITPLDMNNIDMGNDISLKLSYLSSFKCTMNQGVKKLISSLDTSRSHIINTYNTMLQPPSDDLECKKSLLIGVNLDIEFDIYIMDQLTKRWNINFDTYQTEHILPSINNNKNTSIVLFNSFGRMNASKSPKLSTINGSCEFDLVKLLADSWGTSLSTDNKQLGTTRLSTDSVNNNVPTYNLYKKDGKMVNIIKKVMDERINYNVPYSDFSDNTKDTGSDTTATTATATTANKNGSAINYVHVPYNVDVNNLDKEECVNRLKFGNILTGIKPRRRINVLRGSALTYDLFANIASHVVDNKTNPNNIQARFFNFQINTRLRLALGYHAYQRQLCKTLSESSMPTVESSYLYYRFQKWIKWVKDSYSATHNTDVCSNIDDMECCQCCKCVSKRDIQYYTIGYLPLLSLDMMQEIKYDNNPDFWTPRF